MNTSPNSITVGELVTRFLEACGVKTAYGVISIHNMPILDAFHTRGQIRFVSARGEAGACNMADAAARVSGLLGVCVTSTGTGCGNAAGAMVVIGLLPSDVGHRIGRAGAPQSAATRLETDAAVQAGLRHRVQALRDDFGAGHERDACGAMDQSTGVGRPGFDQGHLHGWVFAQTGCQHTPGRAATHDHVVKIHEFPLSKCFMRPI